MPTLQEHFRMYSASTNAVTGTTNRPPRRTLGDLRNTLLVPRTLEDYGYQKLELIAEGGYGHVHKGWDNNRKQVVALKYMNNAEDKSISQATLREVALIQNAGSHENIVKLLDWCFVSSATVMVLEFIDSDLSSFIKLHRGEQRDKLTDVLIKKIMRDILCGTDHLHRRGIAHRDLKPRNILITHSDHRAKIADFGLSKFISLPVRSGVENFGTRWYRAPEVLLGMKTTSMRVDMWSIGTIFAELKERVAIFPGHDHYDQIHLVFKTLGTPTFDAWPELSTNEAFRQLDIPIYPANLISQKVPSMTIDEINVLMMFFQYRPLRRVSAHDALKLPYFAPSSGEKMSPLHHDL